MTSVKKHIMVSLTLRDHTMKEFLICEESSKTVHFYISRFLILNNAIYTFIKCKKKKKKNVLISLISATWSEMNLFNVQDHLYNLITEDFYLFFFFVVVVVVCF